MSFQTGQSVLSPYLPHPLGICGICDKEWHYYVINIEFPVVTLYMDGATYEPYLVTNDWPIHPSHIAMQLTVGACWQGGEVAKPRFAQFFHGSIAGLTIRPGRMESQKVISCLQACKEGLDINSLESLGQGIKYHFNPSQSLLVMEGEDIENLQRALQKVSYINSRQFPTAGIRHLKISSKVQCFGEDTCITVPNIDAYVSVLQANEPRITINGMDHFARPAVEFESDGGVMLLPDIRIVSTVTRMDNHVDYKDDSPDQNPVVVEELTHNLDFCDILVIGEELDPEQECLELNRSALNGKHLDATNSTRGYSIYGVDSMQSYEQALRQVRYRNWQTDSIFDRKFRVKCSELNGRYTSNEFNLEVNMLHNTNVMEHVNHMAVQPQFLQTVHHPVTTVNVSPGAATVVIVVCISILIIIITLGIFRIRESHQLSGHGSDGPKGSEMDWDDSALTITVNPMEKYDSPQEEEESEDENDYDIDDEDDEEETSSDESDESEEEEEAETGREAVKHRACRQEQLERHTSALHY